mmetsp:Transcript_4772/g.10137  ORF Transcript_4772/g.10137 Transcript_4772/m.10137 type:complete len:360 (-) Transcript_4772:1848-2927(-)
MVQILSSNSKTRSRGLPLGLGVFHLFRLVAILLGMVGLLIAALGPSLIGTTSSKPSLSAESSLHAGNPLPQQSAAAMPATKENPAIPHVIYFTYKTNILQTRRPRLFYDNVMNTTTKYMQAWNDGNAQLRFLDDNACREAISLAEPKLLFHFNNETKGAYKADICRAAALYNTGGYYFDVDIRVVNPVLLKPDVVFSSVREEIKKKKSFNFFQAFLASAPRHAVIRETLKIMLAYYEGRHELHGWMGVSTMGDGFKAAAANPNEMGKIRILQELKNVPEVEEYYADLPAQDGIGCCCQHIVHDAQERRVYFYSRIVGAGQYCMSQEQFSEYAAKMRQQPKMEAFDGNNKGNLLLKVKKR